MSLFSWLRPARPGLNAQQQARLQQLAAPKALGEHSLREQRWVVLDLETSGLNLNRDQVLSIGAVVIEDGAVDFSQQFERTLQRADNKISPSVLIHGLGPSAIAAGCDPAEALLDFMDLGGPAQQFTPDPVFQFPICSDLVEGMQRFALDPRRLFQVDVVTLH